ncbi:MAG: TonB-dependent receptor plug domain-containing protein [Burkholderiales bacterium]|nr:TonB-dependent receptor plug domain-containing protein [Burkholderiales bacterium]
MSFLNSVPAAHRPHTTVAAAACAFLLSFGVEAQADNQQSLPTVIVTASRMAQLLQTAPIGATVITSEQIQRSGVSDANEAIRKLGGVAAKTDLTGGREYRLDLRGYGEGASENLVVMVDGIRISENEQLPARLTAIPLDQIDRIELIRGGSSVLWGEGASAGVINVILKRHDQDRSSGRVSAAVESFNGQDIQGSGTLGLGAVTLDGAVRRVRTDGYRGNSAYKQDGASAGLQWVDAGWRVKGRVQQEDAHSGMPGALTFDQFAANPRQTTAPLDFADTHETRYTGDVEYRFGPWAAQLDLGTRQRHSVSAWVSSSFPSVRDSSSRQTQWSPRLSYADHWGAVGNNSVMGLDAQWWSYENQLTNGLETGEQSSHAAFFHSEFVFPSQTRVSAGFRSERIRKIGNFPGDPFTLPAIYDRADHLNAAEAAINQTVLAGLDMYGRVSSSYRLPNVDENRATPFQQALLPQKNRDKELGVKWTQGTYGATWRWFVQTTTHEIAFDPVAYLNVNLEPTRRQGYELEGRWSPLKTWDLTATWQHVNATFRSGPQAGQEQVLVAPETATLRTTYRFNERHQVDVGLQYLASMRFSDYSGNACTRRTPSSTLLDARYAWTDKTWQVAVSGTNLTDHQGYNYAYDCTVGSLYPEPGRALKLTVARQF